MSVVEKDDRGRWPQVGRNGYDAVSVVEKDDRGRWPQVEEWI